MYIRIARMNGNSLSVGIPVGFCKEGESLIIVDQPDRLIVMKEKVFRESLDGKLKL